jgi:hypothetical protein
LNDSLPEELGRLINLHGVDWSGRLINRCGFNFNPVPVIEKNSAIYFLILHWNKVLQKALLPTDPRKVFAEISRLKIHFPGIAMSERENEILIHDYITELSIFPADLIELVCREYRLDGENKYFPKLGHLRSMIIPHFYKRLSKSNRLLALIEASSDEKNQQYNHNY